MVTRGVKLKIVQSLAWNQDTTDQSIYNQRSDRTHKCGERAQQP